MPILKKNIKMKGSAFPPKCNIYPYSNLLNRPKVVSVGDSDEMVFGEAGDSYDVLHDPRKALSIKAILNLKTKQFAKFFVLCLFILTASVFIFIIYYLFLNFEFSYYLVWKNRILIPNLAIAISIVILGSMLWRVYKTPHLNSQNFEDDAIIVFLLSIWVVLIMLLTEGIAANVYCVQVFENLSIIKIPTYEQFEPWAKAAFHESDLGGEFAHSNVTLEFYNDAFIKYVDFANGSWSFDVDSIKNWQENYVEYLIDLDEEREFREREAFFYKKLLAVMLFGTLSFRFLWWSLLNH